VGLALGLQLLLERSNGFVLCGYERGAVRLLGFAMVGSLVVAWLAAGRHLVGM
jgi:hypothetical protein